MRLLLAEDEAELSRAIVAVLTKQGYDVTAVYDGREAVDAAKSGVFDCFILDIMMPNLDGISALKEMRANGNVTPAIFLTAKTEVDDRVAGLDAGADDYLAKPFAMKELIARINSLTRRSRTYTPTEIRVGNVILDTEEQSLKNGNTVRLAKKESSLMQLFMLNKGKVFSLSDIINNVWHDEENAAEDVASLYINYLRDKLMAIDSDVTIKGEKETGFWLE